MNVQTESKCRECMKPLKGRSDKKFCDDYCRSNYNNRINVEKLPFIKKINQVLKKNRKVLQQLSNSGTIKVKRIDLITSGFDFSYFTHMEKKRKHTYTFCYDHGYAMIDSENFLVIKNTI